MSHLFACGHIVAARKMLKISRTLAAPPIKSVSKLSPLASHEIGIGIEATRPETSLEAVSRHLRQVVVRAGRLRC